MSGGAAPAVSPRRPVFQICSKMAAMPCPPPMRCNSWLALVAMIAPVAPTGCPSEMPDPFGLTLAGSKWYAIADLPAKRCRPGSSTSNARPACRRAALDAVMHAARSAGATRS